MAMATLLVVGVVGLVGCDDVQKALDRAGVGGGRYEMQHDAELDRAIQQAMSVLANETFTILLYDAGTFEVLRIPVPLYTLSKTVDEQDRVVKWDSNSALNCSADSYDTIAGWNLQWNFDAKSKKP